ncbi:hypothetical protein DUI87_30298 [Hirundo rustica rustica]|uniref:ribonuclease H n=1 Tax=Hirundo rustica rustica TaxID=333673 RepID=A0A3M0J448_HIRRU|nr:hypothetical protein DUI87_30298 [Hirundo rustica rustica]
MGSLGRTAQGPLGSPGQAAREFSLSPSSPVAKPKVRFSLEGEIRSQDGFPFPVSQDGGDRMARSSPSSVPSSSLNPFLPTDPLTNPFLSMTPPLPHKSPPFSPPSPKVPPKTPPYYPASGNTPMRSSSAQTTPPPGRRASWTSGSHAPTSSSHDERSEEVELGPESMELPQPSPVPSLAQVVYKNSRGGCNVRAVYHPFPQSTIRDLYKAQQDYGRESPYFRGLLCSDLGGATVVPADLKQLFSCLMNSTEFKLWEAAWRQLLWDALPGLLTDPETAADEDGNALTLDRLLGEGHWGAPIDQATTIPPKALHIVRDHALTVFFGMVPDGPVIPYSKITQGPKESFTEFVERLTRAIEIQVPNASVREGILREMAFANSNAVSRNAILSLPLDPPPTIQEMLRVCQIEVPFMQAGDADHRMKTPRVSAIDTTRPSSGPVPQRRAYVPNRQHSRHQPYRLRLTEGLHLKNSDWTLASVNTEEQGAWPVLEGEFIVIGDYKHTPQEIEILLGMLVNNPGRLVLWLRCTHPPTYLPKGQIIAQIIPTRGPRNTSEAPVACPVQAITEERPQVACEFSVGGKALQITGLLDTGADVMIVPAKDWPSHWAFQDVSGHVQGVGGLQLARQSKSVVQIKGPKGQLANIRPFVLNYKEPLLGRDLMAQWGVKIDIPDPSQDFSVAIAEERPTQKLNWKTDSPVWVEQWPLSRQKLKVLEELVEEQLAKGQVVETNSPWNSPVFVIQKPGKDKWRPLHDLCQINNVIEDMGSLQPGVPSPTMLPQNWKLAIIDIKDCFFQIPLHPDEAPRFAFSFPTINREAPRRPYHWQVLPQGMKNSPVICQWYVASLLSPVRAAVDKAIIHHYMDDVLVCAPNDDVLSHALDLTINALIAAGFELQEEKVQRMPPWRYLGLEISKRTIVPQKLEIKTKVSTLADVHQLCGALNWVRPWLGLTTEDLAPLFDLLKGGEELSSPRVLTPEVKKALEKVQDWEKSMDAIKHLIQAFSFMGIPRELKPDNGPAYRSKEFSSFLQQWGVEHKTGIPHSPTGQAVVERTHRDIKRVLHQQQQVLKTEPPSIRLARALFTINFLNCSFEGLNPPVVRHFGASPQFDIKERPPVMVRNPETGKAEGPHDLVLWGHGYA